MITCNETIYQWDVSRTVDVDTDCEVHFALQGEPQALVVASALGKAEIPNVLLQDGRDIIAWQVQEDKTVETKRIAVMRRAKPADYVYTETETITFETLVAEVREAVAKSLEQTERAKQAVSTIEKTNADIQQAETKRAEEFKAMGEKTDAGIAKINKAESDIRQAEAKRVEQEFSRTQAEAKREESFTSNLTSWNQKVDAEVAKTSQAITETNKAKDNAITATNKANEAIAQLPLPTGNVLKGEVQGIIAHADDVYTSKALGFNVYGSSKQYTTTGANKLNPAGITNGSSNGITWTKNENGSITISGTSTALTNINLVANPSEFILSTGKWTGSVIGANKAKLIVQTLDGTQICNTNTSTTREIKTEQGLKYLLLQVQAQTTLNETIFVYLEKSDKALYEEYTDGKPSPSPKYPREITNVKSADIGMCGKNLCEEYNLPNINWAQTLPKAVHLLNRMKGKSISITYTATLLSADDEAKIPKSNMGLIVKGKRRLLYTEQKLWGSGAKIGTTKTIIYSFTIPPDDEIMNVWAYGCGNSNDSPDRTNGRADVSIQIELGTNATEYEPYHESNLPINLQGNELCSLPNGVRDEVRIDKDGNVSLIKRVTKIQSDKLAELMCKVYPADENGNLPYVICNFNDDNDLRTDEVRCNVRPTGNLKKDKSVYATWNALVVVDTRFTDVETAKQILKSENGIYYYEATPQTIPLGKIDMPTLPAPVCNAWANDENPTDVKFSYIRDVNIAYEKLASALASAMNTPTTIPELEL